MDEIRKSQVIRATELYYLENLTQAVISKMMNLSRPTVSRLLEEGRRHGFVEIKVKTPTKISGDLSNRIREKFGLKDAIVVESYPNDTIALHKVAEAAAVFFKTIVKPNSIVGLSWGKSVGMFVDKLENLSMSSLQLVQLSGNLGMKDATIDASEIIIKMATKLNCAYTLVNAPTVLPNRSLVKTLSEEKNIRDALALSNQADIYFGGVGSFSEPICRLQKAGYLDAEEKDAYIKKGAIGHVLARLIDKEGQEYTDFNQRVLTASPKSLQNADYSVCIATGKEKSDALVAAIKGRFYNCIVVDSDCALGMLDLVK